MDKIIAKKSVRIRNTPNILAAQVRFWYSTFSTEVFKDLLQPRSNSKKNTLAIRVLAPSLAPARSGGLNVI